MPEEKQPKLDVFEMEKAAQDTFWGYLGCKLEAVEEERIVLTLLAQKHHLNGMGIVHGGVLASLLDNAMGLLAMLTRAQEKLVTINLNVHFVAPMKEGRLTVTAEIIHQSGKMVTTLGKINDANGLLGTLATGTFRVLK